MIVVEVADFFFLCFFFLEFVVRGNIPKESFVIAMNRPNGQAMASRICFKISMRATRILGVLLDIIYSRRVYSTLRTVQFAVRTYFLLELSGNDSPGEADQSEERGTRNRRTQQSIITRRKFWNVCPRY